MKDIIITEDREQMVKIGKEICSDKSNIYTPAMLQTIRATINSHMSDSTEEEKENMLYMSIYDYWVYGASISEEFYMGFKDKNREERLTYVPFRWRLKHTWELNDRKDEHLFTNKYETYQLLKDYYLRDVIEVKSDEDYDVFVDFITKHPVFVAKPIGLSYGIGVYKVDSRKYDDKKQLLSEILNNGKEITKDVNWSTSSSVVLEELIEQVEELAAIHPYSCNGIRITTLRTDDEVHIIYPWFKIGANKEFVTSAALGTFDAGIDPVTGIVNTDGFKEDGSSEEIHPMTKIRFKGYQIPKWDELVALVKKLSFAVPSIRYTGWDMVLTPKGWCIMEANFSGEYMWQMFCQKGFREELEAISGVKRENEFWWK